MGSSDVSLCHADSRECLHAFYWILFPIYRSTEIYSFADTQSGPENECVPSMTEYESPGDMCSKVGKVARTRNRSSYRLSYINKCHDWIMRVLNSTSKHRIRVTSQVIV